MGAGKRLTLSEAALRQANGRKTSSWRFGAATSQLSLRITDLPDGWRITARLRQQWGSTFSGTYLRTSLSRSF